MKKTELPEVPVTQITISDPEYVLRLWASCARPTVRRWRPQGFEKPGVSDGRAWQAKCRVEWLLSNHHKARAILWIAYVNRASPTEAQNAILDAFKDDLDQSLHEMPITVSIVKEQDERNDFELSISDAIAALSSAGYSISVRQVLRWCESGAIFNYRKGRERMVKWNEIVERMPKKKQFKEAS